MLINRTYKFRLYPNDEHKEIINKTFGCNRFVYNYYLDKKINTYEKSKNQLSLKECINDFKNLLEEYPFLKEVDSSSLRQSLFKLNDVFRNSLRDKTGYPKHKCKFDKNSYKISMWTYTSYGNEYHTIELDLINRTISLPKLKNVKIRGYKNLDKINGRIISATVSKDLDNKYYVSVVVEENIVMSDFRPTTIIGIDLGIKDLIITSNYQKYQNEKAIEKYEKRIKQKQRRLSKKEKGSKNYYKLKQEIAKLYKKVKSARKYSINKITKEITDDFDIIVCESLKVKNMVKNHNLAKAISDASFSEIVRQLEYKAKWKGKKLYKIDTYFPSSQICSNCGYKNPLLKNLDIREYTCPSCHTELDRDYNAAINICFEGLKKYMNEVCAQRTNIPINF